LNNKIKTSKIIFYKIKFNKTKFIEVFFRILEIKNRNYLLEEQFNDPSILNHTEQHEDFNVGEFLDLDPFFNQGNSTTIIFVNCFYIMVLN
jgi:hypothetical protein